VEDPHWDFWSYWTNAAGIDDARTTTHRFSDDFNVQIQAAILGHGVSLARGMLVADDLKAGRLVCPFQLPVRSPVQYYFVYPTNRHHDPLLRDVREWLKQTAEATVAGMDSHWGPTIAPGDREIAARQPG